MFVPKVGQGEVLDQLSKSGLFIVGHARSGTSVLLNALNSSPDACLLGEANFNLSIERPNFAEWYNAMHEGFGNPPAKGYRVPMLEGDGWAVLSALKNRYARIGDKIAFRSRELGYDFTSSFNFQHKYFSESAYLCTLREPRQVLLSNRKMFNVSDLSSYFQSYLECLYHEISIYLTFDRTYFIVYETINQMTFLTLGKILGICLSEAFNEYDHKRQVTRHDGSFEKFEGMFAQTRHYYMQLRSLIDPLTLRCTNRAAIRELQYELRNITVRAVAREAA